VYAAAPLFNALLILGWLLLAGLPLVIVLALLKGFLDGLRR